MKTPISYWGGKQTMLPLLLPLIPEHTTYCEPFFGGGALFFAKPPSPVEIINDINRLAINFYQQAQNNFQALQEKIIATPHSRGLYRDAMVMYDSPHLFTELELAWAFFMLCNQGYSGQIGSWAFATADNSIEKTFDNRRKSFTADLKARLDRVQIECHDALYLIRLRDRETTFFYLDPPYFNSDMGHYGGYTRNDFEALLQHCAAIKGKFLLSSYPSDLLEQYTKEHGWHQKDFTRVTSASPGRKKKVEVLTANYPLP